MGGDGVVSSRGERVPRRRCEAQLLGIGSARHSVREQGVLPENVCAPQWGLGGSQATCPILFGQATIGLEVCLAGHPKVDQRVQRLELGWLP